MSDELEEYLRAKEPGRAELAGIWRAAIGLQKVDGLTTSQYLVDTARRNIEGNTRTTSVFAIKYLRSLGFEVDNTVFAENSYYFRNALVRANYSNIPKQIEETTEYLELFFRNLMLGETNELKSRYLLLGGLGARTPASKAATPASKVKRIGTGALRLSRPLKKIVDVLDGEMSRAAIMKAIGIKDRVTFADYYLAPALKLGLVEMTQPDSPRSPTQKYRLTAKGRHARKEVVA